MLEYVTADKHIETRISKRDVAKIDMRYREEPLSRCSVGEIFSADK